MGGPVEEAGPIHTEEQCGGSIGHGNRGSCSTVPPASDSDLGLNAPWKGVVAACSRGILVP